MLSMLLAVDFAPIIAPVLEVLNALLWPCIAIVGAVGTIYCIFLGIKIAKSDEQNSREKAKKDLIGAIVGFLIIFILIRSLRNLSRFPKNSTVRAVLPPRARWRSALLLLFRTTGSFRTLSLRGIL